MSQALPIQKHFLVTFLLVILSACQSPHPAPNPTSNPISVGTVTDQELIGKAINGGTAPTYRLMEDGSLKHISSWLSLFAYGYIPQEVITIPYDRLKAYPLHKPLTSWVTGVSDRRLYYLNYGKRYLIGDWQELVATGGDERQVTQIPDDLLSTYPLVADRVPPYFGNNPESVSDISSHLVTDQKQADWAAEVDHYLFGQGFLSGRGFGIIKGDQFEPVSFDTSLTGGDDPTTRATVILSDPAGAIVWVGTSYAGLLRYNAASRQWRIFNIFNSGLPDNTISALAYGPDGLLWISTPSGIASLDHGKVTFRAIDETPGGNPGLAMAITADNHIWLAGENTIAELFSDGTQRTWDAFGYPALMDTYRSITLDQAGTLMITGKRLVLRWDGTELSAIDMTGNPIDISPVDSLLSSFVASADVESPDRDYQRWLRSWPRPDQDSGRCIHYVQLPSGEEFEVRQNIARMQNLNIRWVLVNYTDRAQLIEMAPLFKQAGIIAVWRPFVRPYEEYPYWADDVKFLRSHNIPPYIQVYNEPSLGQEWDGAAVDQNIYLKNLIPAVKAVYNAGGYVGIQELEPEWLKVDLAWLKEEGPPGLFDRLFFVPHPYGLNHPPDYIEDINSVLGFREFARIFEEELGFVPPMIAGEGGWRPGEAQDSRFPMVDTRLHSQYSSAVYDWFRLGKLSNNEPLPDYLFAFCPWLLSDPVDTAAWYDSRSGDLDQTIEAIEGMAPYIRKFSWER